LPWVNPGKSVPRRKKMRKQIVMVLFAAFLMIIGPYSPAGAEDSEKEARAVFVRLVQAAKAKNMKEFTSYIAQKDLQEMEKEGFVEVMMTLVAEENPASFKAEVKEDQVIFNKEIKIDTPEEKSSGKTSVYMIKVNGQWKFGKPRDE
jgi:hypothetical protein